jgi:hypothetical protein
MASLYVWKGNGATVCRFHRTPSDWEYEPLSAIETLAFVRMLKAEDLARTSPCEPCEMGYGGRRPTPHPLTPPTTPAEGRPITLKIRTGGKPVMKDNFARRT